MRRRVRSAPTSPGVSTPTQSTARTVRRRQRRRSNSSFRCRRSTAGNAKTSPRGRKARKDAFPCKSPRPCLACGFRFSHMINLLDFDPAALAAFFAERGEKPFRARQALRWIHRRLADRVDAMTDLARTTRDALARDAEIRVPAVVRDTVASDGTRKWLLDVGSANAIETVYIPEDDRGTLCILSQAGCALDCAFCSTGKQGFNRNLSVGEIIGQLWHANRALIADDVAAIDDPPTLAASPLRCPPRGRNSALGAAQRASWVAAGHAPITNVVMLGM